MGDKFKLAAKAFAVYQGKMLVLKRASNDIHFPGIWEPPGGRLELGENPDDGLKREVKEETGLEIDILHPLSIRHFVRQDGQTVTMIIYLCKVQNDEVVISKEHEGFGWVSLWDCKDRLTDFFHPEVDVFHKLELHRFI
tara:strand:+ start:285 stop:701 length:417 start_codon:yes stop_codon:yes gene_type:complete